VGGSGYPFAPEEIFYPRRSTPGYKWKDILPRLGVAYDLFGNGKTRLRFNLGKYMEAITATNNDLDMNRWCAQSSERRADGPTRTGTTSPIAIDEPAAKRRVRTDG